MDLPSQKKLDSCSVCLGRQIEEIILLSQLPLTGIFVNKKDIPKYPNIDQALNLCPKCGHAQLAYSIDPKYLYLETYTQKSSSSSIATSGNGFFADFLGRVVKNRYFESILEIGCNDLYLLKKIRNKGRELIGIEPGWDEEDQITDDKIRVIGKFINDVSLSDLPGKPDLIVSCHTFEHIEDPFTQLQRIYDWALEGAIFVIEVPNFDSLLRTCRFDQVFHQHIHYFSLGSFLTLVQNLDASYLDHCFNYNYWGGTMLLAFQKRKTEKAVKNALQTNSLEITSELVRERFSFFQSQLEKLNQCIGTIRNPIYGFGAAQMLPILAYHMKSDLSFLECILDDNPAKDGMSYPELSPEIKLPEADLNLKDFAVMITALDSTRSLLSRVMSFKPKDIIRPLLIF